MDRKGRMGITLARAVILTVSASVLTSCGSSNSAELVTAAQVAALGPGQSIVVAGRLAVFEPTRTCVQTKKSLICGSLAVPGGKVPLPPQGNLHVGLMVKGTLDRGKFSGYPNVLTWEIIGTWS